MHDHCIDGTKIPKDHCKGFCEFACEYPQYLPPCARGVRQRPQDIKNCPDAELAPRPDCIFHGRVKKRGKEKPEASLKYALLNFFRCKIDLYAECFQHICTA